MRRSLFLGDTVAKLPKTFFTTSGDTFTADDEVVMVYKQVLYNNPAYRVVAATSFTYTPKCRNSNDAFTSWVVDWKYLKRFTDYDWDTRSKEAAKARHALEIFKKVSVKDRKYDFLRATGRYKRTRKSRNKGGKSPGRYGYGQIGDRALR